MQIELRDYQQDAENSIDKYVDEKGGNPVLVEPTGAGKSVVIAAHVTRRSDFRFMMLTHVKELIEQNYRAMKSINPDLDVGIYSAGLKCRDTDNRIICGGIQSVFGKHELFGKIDRIIVDECHLINTRQQGRYRSFIDSMKEVNPDLDVVGFTATPFRLNQGYLWDGDDAIFSGPSHETEIRTLIDRGYLVKPVPMCGDKKGCADLSQVRRTGHDFNQGEMAAAFDQPELVTATITDMIARGQGRRKLIFCASIAHAENVHEELVGRGIPAGQVATVTGKTPAQERREIVEAIRTGELTHLINVGVFTTGFDAPGIDCIVIIRATESTALYVQMVGRGLRPAEGKEDCLVLDYGGNVVRHGPLNALSVKGDGEGKKKNKSSAKACPACEVLIPATARVCEHCNYVYPAREQKPFDETASVEEILRESPRAQIWHAVDDVRYEPHTSRNGNMSMRVTYKLSDDSTAHFGSFGDNPPREWVCFGQRGYAAKKARQWAKDRGYDFDMSLDQALNTLWPKPKYICVEQDGKWRNVVGHHFLPTALEGMLNEN